MRQAVITGASSGLGRAIRLALTTDGYADVPHRNQWEVVNWSLDKGVDVRDWHSVHRAACLVEGKVDVLINCAGINGNEFLENLTEEEFDDIMDTNVKGIFNCTQHLLNNLAGGTILNIVSNAAHIPMTSSLAYNASKGAALMATKQLARELMPRHGITVFSISPNKLKGTAMSRQIEENVCRVRGWTKEEARAYQAKALITGEETDPNDLADFVAYLLRRKQNHKWFAGCDIPYGL